MADQQQQQQQQLDEDEGFRIPPLPPPPPFFQHFTTENLDKLKELENENNPATLPGDGAPAKLSTEQILALPTELRYLIPPEPPAETEEFKVFGTVTTAKGTDSFSKTMEWISQTLAKDYTLTDWEYEQLYPPTGSLTSASVSTTRQQYLFRLLRSILVAYIELLGIVSANPVSEHKEQKLKDLLNMVTNMHKLINEYRPHQARETLIAEMKRQVERKKREIEGVRKMRDRVGEVLEGFGRDIPGKRVEKSEEVVVKGDEERNRDAQRDMWRAMDEVLG